MVSEIRRALERFFNEYWRDVKVFIVTVLLCQLSFLGLIIICKFIQVSPAPKPIFENCTNPANDSRHHMDETHKNYVFFEKSFLTKGALISIKTRSMDFTQLNITAGGKPFPPVNRKDEYQKMIETVFTVMVTRTDEDDFLPITQEWKANFFYAPAPRQSKKKAAKEIAKKALDGKIVDLDFFLAEIIPDGKLASKKERRIIGLEVLLRTLTKKLTHFLKQENGTGEETKGAGNSEYLNSACYESYKNGVEKDWEELTSCLVSHKLNASGTGYTVTTESFEKTDKEQLARIQSKGESICARLIQEKVTTMKNLPLAYHVRIRHFRLEMKKMINGKGNSKGKHVSIAKNTTVSDSTGAVHSENLSKTVAQGLQSLRNRNVTTSSGKKILRKLVPLVNQLKEKTTGGKSRN